MNFSLFIMGTRNGSYRDILDQALAAEELGFSAVHLGERHFEHAGLLCPAPLTLAAAIAGRTKKIRIATAARILPLDHPIRIAEDAATLDILSGGRLDFGATRASLDDRCHAAFGSPVEQSRGRFEEALEIIERAWTRDEFEYAGRHYNIPRLSVAPKPLQKPHPPIFLVAVTDQTLQLAARKGYSAFLGAIRSADELAAAAELYQRVFRQSGRPGRAPALVVNRFIFVAPTDAEARLRIQAPFMAFLAGHAPDLKEALAQKYGGAGSADFDRMAEDFCIFGAPDTIARRLRELQARTRTEQLLCTLNYITLDHGDCLRSMELFARQVMPRLAAEPRRDVADTTPRSLSTGVEDAGR